VRRTLTAALTAAALLLTASPFAAADDAGGGPGDAAEPDPLGRAGAEAAQVIDPSPPTAAETLDAVLLVFQGQGQTARAQRLAAGRDLTLMMRDLRLGLGDLSAADRRTARRVLARPTDGDVPLGSPYPAGSNVTTLDCSAPAQHVCVTYAQTGSHAPANPAQWAATTQAVTENVWNRVVTQGGYRAPRDDSTSTEHGPNGKLDVYVSNLPTGYYGYCTTDDPDMTTYRVSAYCVVDNDYAGFPVNTPLQNLRVTAAHEFFHAVQYAYDVSEDGWLLEGTAAWVEDEIYDAVNDNRQYLATSPLSDPYVALDTYGNGFQYGNWIWWRYLGERYPREGGTGLPRVLRDVIANMGGSTPTSPGRYSTRALARALAVRGSSIPAAFRAFSTVNRAPRRFYDEGSAYPAAPLAVRFTLRNRTERSVSGVQEHLTSDTVRLTPGPSLGRGWQLRVRVDLPPRAYGYGVAVSVYMKSGAKHTTNLAVNAQGQKTRRFGFNSNRVRFVEVTLVNASARYSCWQDTTYACQGTPRDDNRTTRAWFKAVK
jgi:hypothetical protein